MPTTFLELTNRVLRRLNEVEIPQTDFPSVRGIHAAAKDAVTDTLREINSQKFEWPFNAATGTQVLVVGQEEYSWPADLKVVDWNSFYIEKDDTLNINTKELKVLNKDEWFHKLRQQDLDAGVNGRNIPDYVFESWNSGFGVSPSPNQIYTVKFRYWKRYVDLTLYSDETNIPQEYNHVITQGALRHMYIFLDNDEREARAKEAFDRLLKDMALVLIPKDHYVYDTRVSASNARPYSVL